MNTEQEVIETNNGEEVALHGEEVALAIKTYIELKESYDRVSELEEKLTELCKLIPEKDTKVFCEAVNKLNS